MVNLGGRASGIDTEIFVSKCFITLPVADIWVSTQQRKRSSKFARTLEGLRSER